LDPGAPRGVDGPRNFDGRQPAPQFNLSIFDCKGCVGGQHGASNIRLDGRHVRIMAIRRRPTVSNPA